MKMMKTAVALVVVLAVMGLFVSLLGSGAIVSAKRIKSKPVPTPNIGVYNDQALTQSALSIDWGTLTPGTSVTRTLYIKNLGNTRVTLNLATTNWTPTTANRLLTLTWNLEGTLLTANQATMATLTLYVSPMVNGITTFDMDVVISGTA